MLLLDEETQLFLLSGWNAERQGDKYSKVLSVWALIGENRDLGFFEVSVFHLIDLRLKLSFRLWYLWAFLTLGGKDHKADEEHPTKWETLCEQLVFKHLSCMKHEEGTDGAAWVLLSAVLMGCSGCEDNVPFLVLHHVCQFLWIHLQIMQQMPLLWISCGFLSVTISALRARWF